MTDMHHTLAYVREDEAPRLPPPASTVGLRGWLRDRLFSSIGNTILTLVFGAFLLWVFWTIADWAILRASWTGADREACLAENGGACWPLVWAKFPQWIYGFFPIDQRWRVNLAFIIGIAALVPMLIPSVPHKFWNGLFLLLVYPLITLILLTGGNFSFSLWDYLSIIDFMLIMAPLVPIAVYGLEEGIARNHIGLLLVVAGILSLLVSFFVPAFDYLATALLLAGAAFSLLLAWRAGGNAGPSAVRNWIIVLAGLFAAMLLLDYDFGLVPVETSQWGGLTVTLVVSITGIVASLPLGILLALGRRSKMPIVKLFSVIFIEVWRGVPLISVLFMSSVMLPLFLPEGVTFDKLLRALIAVSLFSAAYMAEVVRGGLQAIPKGQYEGAMALGLSYWQMMRMIVLPQALKISIPNIVSNFIGLFKDTTLVSIIGIFDLLGIVQSGLADAKWANPNSGPTSYFAAALMFWVFCFGMSRYSIYTERRLATGHKR
jgi:general L-amino acid transport system permease protein